MDVQAWAPAAIMDAIEASPSTVGLVVLGTALMVVAKIWMGREE